MALPNNVPAFDGVFGARTRAEAKQLAAYIAWAEPILRLTLPQYGGLAIDQFLHVKPWTQELNGRPYYDLAVDALAVDEFYHPEGFVFDTRVPNGNSVYVGGQSPATDPAGLVDVAPLLVNLPAATGDYTVTSGGGSGGSSSSSSAGIPAWMIALGVVGAIAYARRRQRSRG